MTRMRSSPEFWDEAVQHCTHAMDDVASRDVYRNSYPFCSLSPHDGTSLAPSMLSILFSCQYIITMKFLCIWKNSCFAEPSVALHQKCTGTRRQNTTLFLFVFCITYVRFRCHGHSVSLGLCLDLWTGSKWPSGAYQGSERISTNSWLGLWVGDFYWTLWAGRITTR